MKSTLLATAVIVCSALALPATGQAADPTRGEALHDEGCLSCHDSAVYTRADRRIQSLEALNRRVRMCESANHLDWNEADLDDVVAYLNSTFYKFSTR